MSRNTIADAWLRALACCMAVVSISCGAIVPAEGPIANCDGLWFRGMIAFNVCSMLFAMSLASMDMSMIGRYAFVVVSGSCFLWIGTNTDPWKAPGVLEYWVTKVQLGGYRWSGGGAKVELVMDGGSGRSMLMSANEVIVCGVELRLVEGPDLCGSRWIGRIVLIPSSSCLAVHGAVAVAVEWWNVWLCGGYCLE
eukprot:6491854-Amphidinium_carterae.3